MLAFVSNVYLALSVVVHGHNSVCLVYQVSVFCQFMQGATVLDLKKLVHQKEADLPPYLQRVVYQAGGTRTKLEDQCKLNSYPEIRNGSTLFLVRLQPFELYIHDVRGNLNSVTVPSNEPEVCTRVHTQTGVLIRGQMSCCYRVYQLEQYGA